MLQVLRQIATHYASAEQIVLAYRASLDTGDESPDLSRRLQPVMDQLAVLDRQLSNAYGRWNQKAGRPRPRVADGCRLRPAIHVAALSTDRRGRHHRSIAFATARSQRRSRLKPPADGPGLSSQHVLERRNRSMNQSRSHAPRSHEAETNIAGSLRGLRKLVGCPSDNQPALVHASDVMRQLVQRARRFARTQAPILITGESGTGKEVLAGMIHANSTRADQAYEKFNCAAIAASLFESELFGHEQGAFTGASTRRIGWLEHVGNGTLLLDEISEMSANLQAKLLRVLQEREFHRVGGNESIATSARVIATSNRQLPREVARGRFRKDLFYRLNALQLKIPPLRKRKEDLPPLVHYFTATIAADFGETPRTVSPATWQVLHAYDWPGNVRELQNAILHAYAASDASCIEPEHLPELPGRRNSLGRPPRVFHGDMTLAEAERRLIHFNLRRYDGNKTAVARQLGVSPRTIATKLKEYDGLSN